MLSHMDMEKYSTPIEIFTMKVIFSMVCLPIMESLSQMTPVTKVNLS